MCQRAQPARGCGRAAARRRLMCRADGRGAASPREGCSCGTIGLMSLRRTHRAGESIEDFCRACKTDRMHTVIAVDQAGTPLRVTCGYCGSDHNYRGGPRVGPSGQPAERRAVPAAARPAPAAVPLVTARERIAPPMPLPDESAGDLEMLLRRIIREESGLTAVAPAAKWRDGTLVL